MLSTNNKEVISSKIVWPICLNIFSNIVITSFLPWKDINFLWSPRLQAGSLLDCSRTRSRNYELYRASEKVDVSFGNLLTFLWSDHNVQRKWDSNNARQFLNFETEGWKLEQQHVQGYNLSYAKTEFTRLIIHLLTSKKYKCSERI